MTASSQALLDKLQQQNALYFKLKAVCEKQSQLITAERVSELLEVMRQKEELVGEINGLEEEIAILSDLWESEVERDDIDLAVAREIERKKQLILHIIESEREAEAKVQRLQQRVVNVLQILSRGREMFNTLKDSSQGKSRFIDRTG